MNTVILMGESRRGPCGQVVPADEAWRFSDTLWESVDLGASGDLRLPDGVYQFLRYGARRRTEGPLQIKAAGTNAFRLLAPVIPGTVTVLATGLTLSLTSSTPSSLEYQLDPTTGLLTLGATYTALTISYQANAGPMEAIPMPWSRFIPASGSTLGTLSWSSLSTTATGEYWVQHQPAPVEHRLLEAFDRSGLQGGFLVRSDASTPALCTIACSTGTLVLKSEPGADGNLWLACWDTDCLHIRRAPGYAPRWFHLPLSLAAATRWGALSYPETDEQLVFDWGHLIEDLEGSFIGTELTPGSAAYTGGVQGTTAWADLLETVSTDAEGVFVPLGAGVDDIASLLEISEDDGFWPLAIVGSTTTVVPETLSTRVAQIAGQVTYQDGFSGTAVAALAGALSRGQPYRLGTLTGGPPAQSVPELIYPYETLRYGWMVTRLPMLAGTLQLNHHLWLQALAREMRACLTRYLGMLGMAPEVVAMDQEFQRIVTAYDAEYQLALAPDRLVVSLLVHPPGVVSEVVLRVST
jgi:hypothetical protein